jgi:hypothetical protein
MPIYEYYSPDNNTIYQFLARSASMRDKMPRCPADTTFRMEKRVSAFALTGLAKKSEKETGADGEDGPDLDDPRMEAAMAELEREMEGMDEENPDPRRLAQLMRKMSDLTGEKLPPEMQEMVGRLEKGEDPEKLEEEYGDLLGDDGDGMDEDGYGLPGGAGAGAGGEEAGSPGDKTIATPSLTGEMRRLLQAHRNQPRRDPNLYDLADFI